jgi:hypothetical protein
MFSFDGDVFRWTALFEASPRRFFVGRPRFCRPEASSSQDAVFFASRHEILARQAAVLLPAPLSFFLDRRPASRSVIFLPERGSFLPEGSSFFPSAHPVSGAAIFLLAAKRQRDRRQGP